MICDEGCTYNEINTEFMTISCDCKIKNNISVNDSTLNIKKIDEIKTESNFGLIKCYNLVFSFDGKPKNMGFWIFLILSVTHIPFLIFYFSKGVKPIKHYLLKEMEKNGYINSDKKKKNTNINNKNTTITNNNIKKYQNKNNKNYTKKQTIKNKSKIHSPPISRKIKIEKSEDSENNNKIIKKRRKSKKISNKMTQKIEGSSLNCIKFSEREDGDIVKQIKYDNNKFKNNNEKNTEIKRKSTLKKNIKIDIKRQTLIKSKIIGNELVNSSNKIIKKFEQLPTQGIEKINEKGKNIFNFNLININLKNIKDYSPKNSYHILNNYTFEEAVEYDMRSVCAIFYIFLLSKDPLCHAFLFKSPLELFPLRFCLLIFIISSDLALNAFFYLDDKISEKYKYAQNLFLFAFSSNLTIILLSTFIGFLFMTLFTNLSNSTNNIRDIFKKEEEKIKKNKKYEVTDKRKKEIYTEINKILRKHKIKVIILISIEFLLMLFFWYYVTAFCHVYSNTQLSWLLDSFLSILSRIVIVLFICLGFAKLYRMAVESSSHSIYKFVLFFYSFG